MQLNGFPEEIKRLCSLIFGDHSWILWLHSNSDSHTIDAQHIQICTLEERALIKQFTLSSTNTPFSATSSPVIQQYLKGQSLLSTQFITIEIGQQSALLAFHKDIFQLAEIAQRLIQDRWNEWQLRGQLAQLIEQQQQRIQQSDERFETFQQQRAQQLTQLIDKWVHTKTHLSLTLEPSIVASFDYSTNDDEVILQLENALRIAQFAQPNQVHYFISTSHILPVSRSHTPTHIPLSGNQRIELLLDKYEASARIAQQNGFVVNGKTIAEHLQPAISPPAITDAMKKNRKTIGLLLEQYPEKWPLLRKFLKPVKELNERAFFQSIYQKTLNE